MENEHTNLEISVASNDAIKRRIHISTAFKALEGHELHAQVPLVLSNKDTWKTVVIDVAELVASLFHVPFKGIDSVVLRPVCRIRRIFTLPYASAEVTIPPTLDFPSSGLNVDPSTVYIPSLESNRSKLESRPQETIDAIVLGMGSPDKVSPMKLKRQDSSSQKGANNPPILEANQRNLLLKKLRCIERLLASAKREYSLEFSRVSLVPET